MTYDLWLSASVMYEAFVIWWHLMVKSNEVPYLGILEYLKVNLVAQP